MTKPYPTEDRQRMLTLEYKAYAAVVYLAAMLMNHPDPKSLNVKDYAGSLIDSKSPHVYNLGMAITSAFNPPGSDLVDDRMAFIRTLDYYVFQWFPTARERIECRDWLINLCVTMNIDIDLVYQAFPMQPPNI